MQLNVFRMRLEMARACMGVNALAEKAGINDRTIYRMIQSGTAKLENVGKIAKAMGVEVEVLISTEDAQ